MLVGSSGPCRRLRGLEMEWINWWAGRLWLACRGDCSLGLMEVTRSTDGEEFERLAPPNTPFLTEKSTKQTYHRTPD